MVGCGKPPAWSELAARDPQSDPQKRYGHHLSIAEFQQTAGVSSQGVEDRTRESQIDP